jgi:hypothetical protein
MSIEPRPSDGVAWRQWFMSGAAAANDKGGTWWSAVTRGVSCSFVGEGER